MSKKRLLLIFPPLTTPTSPPLGIAMLKGYVERTAPDWSVELLDLNLWCFQWLISGLQTGVITLGQKFHVELGASKEELLLAIRVFRSADNDILFSRPDLYNESAKVFSRFTLLLMSMFEADCSEWERTQHISPLLQTCLDMLLKRRVDCVGISMIFSSQLSVGAMLGRFLRQRIGVKVFFGGSCFIEGAEQFLRWYPEAADVIITGDGEESLRRLLEPHGDPARVSGAVFRDGNAIRKIPPLYEKNIDHFGSPNFDGLDLSGYFALEPIVPLLLSRGCYWRKCTFCVHYFSAGDSYRVQTVDAVIKTIVGLVSTGIRNFSFVDEMIAPGYFVKLAQAIKQANLDIAYYAYSKPNKAFTSDVLKQMAESGCKYLLWGVESGNQRILDKMGKGTEVSEIATVLKAAHEAGIANHVFIICGFPTETQNEFLDTLRFLDANRTYIYAVHRGVFSLEAGSPIHRNPGQFGIVEMAMCKETPLGGRLTYRCSSGVTAEQADENFKAAVPFFRAFHPHAQFLEFYRDHALLVYKKLGVSLHQEFRRFPRTVLRSTEDPTTCIM